MGKMDGKVALVSGGAEGIGATVGRMIVAEGGSVMLADVQIDKARALAAELGDRADAIELDVRDLDAWHRAVDATVKRFGKLTVLCNIAGISEPGNVPDGSLDVWQRTIDINLNGPYYGCRAAIPAMEKSGEPCAIEVEVMAEEDGEEKSQEPTDKRKQDAREEGRAGRADVRIGSQQLLFGLPHVRSAHQHLGGHAGR